MALKQATTAIELKSKDFSGAFEAGPTSFEMPTDWRGTARMADNSQARSPLGTNFPFLPF